MGGLPRHELASPLPHGIPFTTGSFHAMGPLSQADFPHRQPSTKSSLSLRGVRARPRLHRAPLNPRTCALSVPVRSTSGRTPPVWTGSEEPPGLAEEGLRVGINWTRPRLVGWDFNGRPGAQSACPC